MQLSTTVENLTFKHWNFRLLFILTSYFLFHFCVKSRNSAMIVAFILPFLSMFFSSIHRLVFSALTTFIFYPLPRQPTIPFFQWFERAHALALRLLLSDCHSTLACNPPSCFLCLHSHFAFSLVCSVLNILQQLCPTLVPVPARTLSVSLLPTIRGYVPILMWFLSPSIRFWPVRIWL